MIFPELGDIADYPCPQCGSPVEDFVCTNADWGAADTSRARSVGMGMAGWVRRQRPATITWRAGWTKAAGGRGPSPPTRCRSPQVALEREPTELEIGRAFGELAVLASAVYGDEGYSESGSLSVVYEELCDDPDSFIFYSSMTRSMHWSFADVFALDPSAFGGEVVDLCEKLAAGITTLDSLDDQQPGLSSDASFE